jgi:hypothetical protein
VRPIGARDTQETVPPVAPQFFWIWAPANFETGSFFFHTNDDADGTAWNRRAVWATDGATAAELDDNPDCAIALDWQSGTRHARRAVVSLRDQAGERRITYEPQSAFFMLGLGYGHPKWGHGLAHGPLVLEREDLKLADVDPRLPHHLHVQALCRVTYADDAGRESVGRGVLEQLALGPHKTHGLTGILDFPA